MKQTAVEWLVEEYVNKSIITIEAIEQAKAMEKEQIKEAEDNGFSNGFDSAQPLNQNKMTPKEKAKELVFKKFGCSKRYALIAVDEILKKVVLSTMYWQEVKQEILKL